MSDQEILAPTFSAVDPARFKDAPAINVPADFNIQSVDNELRATPQSAFHIEAAKPVKKDPTPPPGVLALFKGSFGGSGFNTIFRPSNAKNRAAAANNPDLSETKLDNPIDLAAISNAGAIDDNILELNLTEESLKFTTPIGAVPNRGSDPQQDIVLLGVPYVQSIKDVTNVNTGRGDAAEGRPIHFEPGMFMHVPKTSSPNLPASICRMASIPHGTTINISGTAPEKEKAGPPTIPKTATAPPVPIKFPNLGIDAINSARLPQNLSKFKKTGTITQEILNDPNKILSKVNQALGDRIVSHWEFKVETPSPQFGTAIGNIPFLAAAGVCGVNANATRVSATFWVSKVRYNIQVPTLKAKAEATLTPTNLPPGAKAPVFRVKPEKDIKGGQLVVTSTMIQYSQLVILNFKGLDWPHVSVASLVPVEPVAVEAALLNKLV